MCVRYDKKIVSCHVACHGYAPCARHKFTSCPCMYQQKASSLLPCWHKIPNFILTVSRMSELLWNPNMKSTKGR